MWQKFEAVTFVHSGVQHYPRSQTSGDVEHIQSQGQGVGSDDSDDSVGNNPRRFQRCQVRPHSQAVADWFVDANMHVSHCHGTVLLMTHSLSDCTAATSVGNLLRKAYSLFFKCDFDWTPTSIWVGLSWFVWTFGEDSNINGSKWFIMG